ncbi:hypothetical protein [Enterobacter kobei]|uniref:hypothetical protein n=1 Tax=Enterobacter kobei TaxID=208224 RepID=UPI00186770B7|nr:hypothetical protein [Enterobacter kobei]
MCKHKYLVLGISVALAFIGLRELSIHFTDVPSIAFDGLMWAVAAASATLALVVQPESWKVVERMFTRKVKQLLNIFSSDPRSTGALCSPLI